MLITLPLRVGVNLLEPITSAKVLGVQLSSDLTMDRQISAIVTAANFNLYRLGKVRGHNIWYGKRTFPTPSNPKPTSVKTVSHFPPFEKNHRRGFGTKDFEGRSVSDLKGWGKRLEMAAEMCELMQKRVDF